MKRLLFLFANCCIPLMANAGVCEMSWDADNIVKSLSDRPSYLKIPLKDKNQGTNEVTLAQVRAFHDAKEKIAQVAGTSPNLIICGDPEPNAFASTSSKGEVVGVTLGMLRLADGDPDMAAAVIGHEFAHHVKHHESATQNRNAIIGLIGLVASIALEYNIQEKYGVGGLGLDLGQLGEALASRKFDRDQEREADDLGFQYILAAGLNPTGSIKLAERFSQLGHGGGGWFFDSHPGWDERAELFKIKIASSPEAQQIIARASSSLKEDAQHASKWAETDKTDAQRCDRYASFEDVSERDIRKAHIGYIDVEQALPPCSAAYKKNPKNTRIQAQLARIYFQQGKFTKGVELAKTSMKDQRVALVMLAYAYQHGIGGLQLDLSKAAKLLQQGVDRGEPDAMNGLGAAYAHGKGVEKDERLALDLLQRAADTGELDAIYNLATVRFFGLFGANKDVNEGLRLMRKSADSGYPIALLRLGMMLAAREKRMTPEAQRYIANAREQIEQLSRQGSVEAMAALGEIFEKGIGAPKNHNKAFDLYLTAANHSHIKAMTRLGIAYLDGMGTDINPSKGRQWLEKAAKLGSDAAEKKLKEIGDG
ncbi:hypothetical protein EGI20_08235 [Aquitalea sp. S1-19]|nr:hypothetical protein [Aquitalea sp. S1-19]